MAKKNNTLANKIALTGEQQYTQAMRNITSILAAEELDRLVEKTGEQSQESLKVRTTLNNARAEMARTGAQLKALRGQMDDAADGTQDVETGLEVIGQSA